ncbi:MAG: AAA family ATPase [Cyanobacteria bacterium P01_F01_bin.150]
MSYLPPTVWAFPHCPTARAAIDWNVLLKDFDWLRVLKDCPQDPIYHAEGDVLTHTQMVCEALIALPGWHALSESDRSVLFAATLLHDVAKPQTTQLDSDGRLTAKGHGHQGAKMARRILWDMETPFYHREAIVNLIQYGSLPLWFWDKPNPQQSVIKASQMVCCEWISLLAEADVRGRQCYDQQTLLDSVGFFREFCQEQGCLDRPKPFASDHSRFMYFQKEHPSPDYDAFDDTCFDVILMSGLPGAGKDSWIREFRSDWPVISLDGLRSHMKIRPDAPQGKVVNQGKMMAREYARKQQSFVWNATNISQQLRSGLVNLVTSYRAKVHLVYLEAPWPELVRRNRSRTNPVPQKVLDKLRNRLEVPIPIEAHTVEWINSP